MHHHDFWFVSQTPLAGETIQDRWTDGWMFKCRSGLICSVIIYYHHISYYICQMKSLWLQPFLTKKQPFDVWKNVCIYWYNAWALKNLSLPHSRCSSFHSNSGCDDKNKGRQASWGRRQSVRQSWIKRLPQVWNIWTALIPRRALDPPHRPPLKWTGNPGRRETGNKRAVL